MVFHTIREGGLHPVLADGIEVGRGLFYPEICEALEGRLAASTVRFSLGSLFHLGVISKQMLPGRKATSFRTRQRPATLYWTAPGWSEEDPRRAAVESVIPYSRNLSVVGMSRSRYRPEGPQGPRWAERIWCPSWAKVKRGAAEVKDDLWLAELEASKTACIWAVHDDSIEDESLDWFDTKGRPFATTPNRNPYGPGHPDDLPAVRWYIRRMDSAHFGHNPDWVGTKRRNERRKQRGIRY